jgi:hypothetical protein
MLLPGDGEHRRGGGDIGLQAYVSYGFRLIASGRLDATNSLS